MLITYKTILSKKTQLNSDTYLYHFDLTDPKEIIFKPGQYVMLKVPSDKGPISRLYSIASSNNDKAGFELIVEIVPGGLASNYLFSMSEKAEVIFQGPAGMFGLKENKKEKVFLVTGTGIAPARSMLGSDINNQKYHLFWGMKSYQDIYILNELKQWNNETMKQFEFKICLSREQNLEMIPETDRKFFGIGHVDSCFMQQFNHLTVEQLNNLEFYLCGGRLIVESLRQFLQAKNVLRENIIFEKF
jgi:NAD(P)H-flavin reductase